MGYAVYGVYGYIGYEVSRYGGYGVVYGDMDLKPNLIRMP